MVTQGEVERRENETSEEYVLRLFTARKMDALNNLPSACIGSDLPEAKPGEPEAIARLREELASLAALADAKVHAAFAAEEAYRRAQQEQDEAYSAACSVLHELRAIFHNAEIVIVRRNGRGRRRTIIEALPDRAQIWTLQRKADALNADFQREGSTLFAMVCERKLPPGVEEPANETEADEAAFETTRNAVAFEDARRLLAYA